MNKVSLINLGCVRNLVDAQGILGELEDKGFEIVSVDEADTVIINTCGFIKDAKQESIDVILEVLDLKKAGEIEKVIVAGCLSQRYADELKQEFPEIDAFLGIQDLVQDSLIKQKPLTPGHMAYIKICESCFNQCAFCIIPKIKGKFKSRTIDSILEEVKQIDRRDTRELNIVGQDITAYGLDLYGEKSLAELLEKIAHQVRNIQWIRLLYTFPAHITYDLMDVIARERKVCNYIDVPFQHVSDKILKNMNRGITSFQTKELVGTIRERIPGVKIRSTFIVGLPGEGETEFAELREFMSEARFDHVGVFKYSPEEGTPAFSMPEQVSEDVKEQRFDELMQLQQKISMELNTQMIGRQIDVLVEGYDEEQKLYFGRSAFDAPDVDGATFVRCGQILSVGEFVRVRITEAYEYDLVGEVL